MRSLGAFLFIILSFISFDHAEARLGDRLRARVEARQARFRGNRPMFASMGGFRSSPSQGGGRQCLNCVANAPDQSAPLGNAGETFVSAPATSFAEAPATRTASGPDLHEAPSASDAARPVVRGASAGSERPERAVDETKPVAKAKTVTAGASPDFAKIEALIQDEAFINKMNNTINARNPGHGDLKKLISKWHASNPSLTLNQLALTLAVLEEGGASSALGVLDPSVCRMSDSYAASDARAGRQQGHAGFQGRFDALRAGGARSASEIEAESWPTNMLGNDLMVHARDCVKSWKQSPGHYADMMRYHTRFCYSMARQGNGTYYCIGLFAE